MLDFYSIFMKSIGSHPFEVFFGENGHILVILAIFERLPQANFLWRHFLIIHSIGVLREKSLENKNCHFCEITIFGDFRKSEGHRFDTFEGGFELKLAWKRNCIFDDELLPTLFEKGHPIGEKIKFLWHLFSYSS